MNEKEKKIVKANIRYPSGNVIDAVLRGESKAVVTATFEDGSVSEVLRFYSDELNFSEAEFAGLTRAQVGQLFIRKDVAYLRSRTPEEETVPSSA